MTTTEPKTIDEVRDPVGRRYWPANKGRDGERTPMQWDASPQTGFTTGQPWLPVPPSARERNVAVEERDPESLLNFYRRLIALRRRSPALLDGKYAIVGNDPHVFAYKRSAAGQTVIVALNMSGEGRTLKLPPPMIAGPFGFSVALSSSRAPQPRPEVYGQLSLAPFEAVVLEAKTK